MRSNPKFLNLVLLNGEPEQKLRAAQAAGFEQVEIWREDVEAATPQLAQQLNLGFTNLQVLRDFTGAPDRERLQKREELRQFIQIAQSIGCNTIQAPATTRDDCVAEQIGRAHV